MASARIAVAFKRSLRLRALLFIFLFLFFLFSFPSLSLESGRMTQKCITSLTTNEKNFGFHDLRVIPLKCWNKQLTIRKQEQTFQTGTDLSSAQPLPFPVRQSQSYGQQCRGGEHPDGDGCAKQTRGGPEAGRRQRAPCNQVCGVVREGLAIRKDSGRPWTTVSTHLNFSSASGLGQ